MTNKLYKDLFINEEVFKEFIQLIIDEREIRKNKGSWPHFRYVFYGRLKLYPEIFQFNEEYLGYCWIAEKEYKVMNLYAKAKN